MILLKVHGEFNFEFVEKAKDGNFFNGKYSRDCVRYARTMVICFSNAPPENPEALSADRWKILQLEVRTRR